MEPREKGSDKIGLNMPYLLALLFISWYLFAAVGDMPFCLK